MKVLMDNNMLVTTAKCQVSIGLHKIGQLTTKEKKSGIDSLSLVVLIYIE